MMQSFIPLYNKIIYVIINTLHQITTSSSIYFAETHSFGNNVFKNLKIWTMLNGENEKGR